MAKVVVFGADDIARLAHVYFSTDSDHELVAFAVDAAYRDREEFQGLPLAAAEELLQLYPPLDRPHVRRAQLCQNEPHSGGQVGTGQGDGLRTGELREQPLLYLSQHPPGDDCFILEDNAVQPFVRIRSNITLWSGNHIGHGSTIADHCFLKPPVVVSGHADVGASCFIGVNATLRNSTIGERTDWRERRHPEGHRGGLGLSRRAIAAHLQGQRSEGPVA